MANRVIIEIPEKESFEDDVMILGISGTSQKGSEIMAIEAEKPLLAEFKYRSYFEIHEDDQLSHELTLRPVKEAQPPIAFESTTNYLKVKIVLTTPTCVSTKDLDLDAIEAVVITIHHNTDNSPVLKSEMIASEEFKRLCSKENVRNDINKDAGNLNNPPCFRWKLHEKLVVLNQEEPTLFVMNVKTWQGEPIDHGTMELHYAELHTDAREYYKGGNPYFDMAVKGPMVITGHTMSGDGSRILVTSVADNYRFLQLWNFKETPPVVESTHNESLIKDPFRPQLLAWMQLPYIDENSYECYLNWDGTQLVCNNLDRPENNEVEEAKKHKHKRIFLRKRRSRSSLAQKSSFMSFYKVEMNYTATPKGAIAGFGFRRFEVDGDRCPGLRDVFAKAAFHIISPRNQNVEDELFVTCNGVTFDVYRVFEEWSHIRSIKIDRPWSEPKLVVSVIGSLMKQIRGPYLVLGNPDACEISTWNIEKGVHVSSFMDLTHEQFKALRCSTAISKDGRLIAIPGKHHVDIFWTATWTRSASYTIRDMTHDPLMGTVKFIRNDTQLMVDYKSCASFCKNNHGSIFNTDNLAPVEQLITDGCDTIEIFTDEVDDLQVFNVGFSQLSLCHFENFTFESSSRRKKHCMKTCFAYDSYDYGYAETLAPSGLTFRAEKSMIPVITHGRRQDLPFVTVTVLDKNGLVCQKLPIPLPKDLDFNIHHLNFVGRGSYLALSLKGLVLIWSMPTTVQEKFTLLLAHTCPDGMHWEVCIHDQLYGLLPQDESVDSSKSLDDPVRGTEADFLGGAEFLPEIFQNADDSLRDDILQYIGRHINLYIAGTEYDSNIVQYTCAQWTIDNHHSTVLLWKVLLAHPIGRWIPRHDMVRETNPIWCLLSKTYEHPKAYELALVFIDYCIRQTKLEMDPHFLLPIRQCFQELTDPRKPYSDVTLELFRQLAYIPARDRDFIIEHHWIAQPYKLRWRFWNPYTKGLHQYRDQVLQVTSTPTEHQPKYIFSRDIYLATYDMLWLKRKTGMLASEDPEKSREGKLVFSWPYAIRSLIYRRMWPFQTPTVECHPFDRDTLDNPALAALVEFKWNTIGFHYWLIRFLSQCLYYTLVLVAAFMQIDGVTELPKLYGIYAAIISISSIFLWLELSQLLEDKRRYFQSVYNFVDLLVFMFPLIGSVLELVWSNPERQNSLFSFSVLYVALHFGGRYDNLSGEFDSDDVGFHLLMAIFFFFTVILMLNVLIALINNAIDDGDRTWELDWLQNRMRYVESAENLTYDLPGYRAAYNFFPETIYYTATPLQAREYKKKTQKIIEETATTAEMSIVAESKPQMFLSGSGDEGGYSWQDSTENNSDGTTNSDSNAALLKLMKQLHDEQQQSRLEQQRMFEKFRRTHEDQQQTADELRKEIALLKEKLER
ncbi:hypothetical protein FBU30_010877 [Linnemannia zychae]|nr:hypothetical protein FBU30_010877 [Linnemannia zychae]